MRVLGTVLLAATLLAACATAGTGPSAAPASARPTATAAPIASPVDPASPKATADPPADPTPVIPKPPPTAVADWPAVHESGVTLIGAVEETWEMNGRLGLSVTVLGLGPGEGADLTTTGAYEIGWTCGSHPGPCGELGCGPAFTGTTKGTATAAVRALVGVDGVAAARIELVATPPRESCPADAAAPWGTFAERWVTVRIVDGVHGLVLTPAPVERAMTY
jgi:hypothetical protein